MKKFLMITALLTGFTTNIMHSAAAPAPTFAPKAGEFELDLLRRHLSLEGLKAFILSIDPRNASLLTDTGKESSLFKALLTMKGLNAEHIEKLQTAVLDYNALAAELKKFEAEQTGSRLDSDDDEDDEVNGSAAEQTALMHERAEKKRALFLKNVLATANSVRELQNKVSSSLALIRPIFQEIKEKLIAQAKIELSDNKEWRALHGAPDEDE